MKAIALSVLWLSFTLTLAQTSLKPKTKQQSPQLHVIFALEPKGVEYGRLNMENDSIMRQFVEVVQRGLGYPMQMRWLDTKHFTSNALKDTIAALKTTPNDIVILYYSGYGIRPAKATETFANWRLDDVKDTGLPLNDVEGWLKLKNINLALLIADCTTERIQSPHVVAMIGATVDLTPEIMKQLFLRNKGIVRLGSSAPSLPAYIVNTDPGTVFTNGLYQGFQNLLNYTDPASLPYLSFEDLQYLTNSAMRMPLGRSDIDQTSVLELKNWDGTRVVKKQLVAGAVPVGVRWQGFIDNEQAYNELRKKQRNRAVRFLPTRVDLSMYAPPVLDQGDKGNCVAISIGYYMRSIMEAVKWNITDKNTILKRSFSPFYLYGAIKQWNDKNCTYGIEAGQALEYLKNGGLPYFSAFPDPNLCEIEEGRSAMFSQIQDYVKLFNIIDPKQEKVLAVKQALAEKAPVVIGIQTTSSLQELSFTKTLIPRLKGSVWELLDSFSESKSTADRSRPKLDMSWKPYQANALAFGHAVCVVGYDDTMLGKGAFKLVNSWGRSWGDGGYFWMSYDTFGKFAKYGYQAYLSKNNSPVRLDTDLTIAIGASRYQPSFTRMPSDTGLVTYAITRSLRTGTKFKFSVDAKKQTYLYLIKASKSDSAAILQLAGSATPTVIAPANRVYYPSADEYLTLNGKPDLEYLLFLFSDRNMDYIHDFVQEINALKGSFPERVKRVFGKQLIPNRQIQYKPKKMGFFLSGTKGVSGWVVPLLVSINHVP